MALETTTLTTVDSHPPLGSRHEVARFPEHSVEVAVVVSPYEPPELNVFRVEADGKRSWLGSVDLREVAPENFTPFRAAKLLGAIPADADA